MISYINTHERTSKLPVIVANIDLLLGYTAIAPELRPVITGVVMAILSPIMSELGGDPE